MENTTPPLVQHTDQNRVKFYIAGAAMLVSLFLPWYVMESTINLGDFGGSSGSIAIDGTRVTGGIGVAALAALSCFLKFKNSDWSAIGAIGNLIIAVLAYFNKLGVEGMNYTSNIGNGKYGASVEFATGYGIYVLAAASIAFLVMDIENIKKALKKIK